MPKRKITPDEIVAALRKIELAIAQGVPASSAVKAAGMSSATYYRWLQEYGGMNADQIRRLMMLKQENVALRDRLETLHRVAVWDPSSERTSYAPAPASPIRPRAAGATREFRPTGRTKPAGKA